MPVQKQADDDDDCALTGTHMLSMNCVSAVWQCLHEYLVTREFIDVAIEGSRPWAGGGHLAPPPRIDKTIFF